MIKLFIYPIVGLIINFLKSIDVIANEGLKDEGLSKFEMRSQQVLFFLNWSPWISSILVQLKYKPLIVHIKNWSPKNIPKYRWDFLIHFAFFAFKHF
jgi:hypothetical protein